MSINIGRHRHRLKFKRPVDTVQADGSVLRTWQQYATRWASIKNESGRELMDADRPQDRTRVVVSIRGMEELREFHRVEDGPYRYEVQNIADVAEIGEAVNVLTDRRRLRCLTVNGQYVKAGGNYISLGEDIG
jgi:SPP1 family predicted phage head-tail adaptor